MSPMELSIRITGSIIVLVLFLLGPLAVGDMVSNELESRYGDRFWIFLISLGVGLFIFVFMLSNLIRVVRFWKGYL